MSNFTIPFRFIITFCFYFYSWSFTAQQWKAHPAFGIATDFLVYENQVFVAAQNSVYVFDTSTNTYETYTTVNGLSGMSITKLHYNASYSYLIIGYEDGLLQLLNTQTGLVSSFPDIRNQQNFLASEKQIIDLTSDETGTLYIGTGFGLVTFDLQTLFFENTYLDKLTAGVKMIKAVAVLDTDIYVSIDGLGTYKGAIQDNLILFENWLEVSTIAFEELQQFSGNIIAHQNSQSLYQINPSQTEFEVLDTLSSSVKSLQSSLDTLYTTCTNTLITYNNSFNSIFQYDLEANTIESVLSVSDTYYFLKSNNGGLGTTTDFVTLQDITPSGPYSDNAYAIDAHNGQIWLTYGALDRFFTLNFSKLPLSHYQNGAWETLPYSDFNAATLTDVTIDKTTTNNQRVIFSSLLGGILILENGSFTLYDSTNSNLDQDISISSYPDLSLVTTDKAYATTFDAQNRLWVINPRTQNPIKRFAIAGENTGLSPDFSAVLPTNSSGISYNFWDILVSSSGNVFAGAFNQGLVAHNPTTGQMISLKDPEINDIPFVTVRAVAEDHNGELWIGTTSGLRKFSNPDEIFITGSSSKAEPIIFLEDGIAQELLYLQFITDIVVDADNNKWISTIQNGVYQISPDGQEILNHFTTYTSPLPSNNVEALSIDQTTGVIYMATQSGLMEYRTGVIQAANDLQQVKVYPNPLRPEHTDVLVRIEGLSVGANVKITDVLGNLVFEAQNDQFGDGTGSGVVEWDSRNFSNKKVASGVYLVLITGTEGTATQVEKLLIIR